MPLRRHLDSALVEHLAMPFISSRDFTLTPSSKRVRQIRRRIRHVLSLRAELVHLHLCVGSGAALRQKYDEIASMAAEVMSSPATNTPVARARHAQAPQ
eukprot:370185-Pleurochrysis_carterae.AAC.1